MPWERAARVAQRKTLTAAERRARSKAAVTASREALADAINQG